MPYILFKLGKLTLRKKETAVYYPMCSRAFVSTFLDTTSRRLYFTLQGKLNSLMKPKSSPVASNFLSLVSEEALTKLSVGQIPSHVAPRTDVHVAHSTFSNCTNTHAGCTLTFQSSYSGVFTVCHFSLPQQWRCSVSVHEELQKITALWHQCLLAAIYLQSVIKITDSFIYFIPQCC